MAQLVNFFIIRDRTFVPVVYGEYTLSIDRPQYPNKKVIYYFISLDLVTAYPGTTARFTILFCLYALNYTKTCAYTNTAVLLSISMKYNYYFARFWLKIMLLFYCYNMHSIRLCDTRMISTSSSPPKVPNMLGNWKNRQENAHHYPICTTMQMKKLT